MFPAEKERLLQPYYFIGKEKVHCNFEITVDFFFSNKIIRLQQTFLFRREHLLQPVFNARQYQRQRELVYTINSLRFA